eukprot:CAMPEP_0114454962 /NCGR_PEP_ID=MMETSP0104-20121206/2852_1 /TAXON_ID=37642 ORGANISM="Paraphysomonas imperforata, Strain PA2" /NCGR_SAMPLE_ID=MMETSP0104 /ASSEMBLY_ACC=CAM_ASM_000202 /LENGTH=317 /DNA_ID=CAMNT_0001627363 /DNA_START=85 /DNA_END=1035 /DNA_ORIENTATION=-
MTRMRWLALLFFTTAVYSLGMGMEGDVDSWVYLSSEVSIPRVGFGTCGLHNTGDMTCAALKNGVKMLDSAQAREWYKEDEVGRAIRNAECQAPDDLVVITKVHPRSYEVNAMRTSLLKSQVDLYGEERKLNVVLLHAPFCWEGHCNAEQTEFMQQGGWHSAWRNLEQMHDEGLVSAIGVSNFHPNQLVELVTFVANKRVAVVQNFMDPFNQDREVLRLCQEHNIAYMAYSSLGNQWRRGNPIFKNEVLQRIAAQHETDVSAVVLSWVLSTGAIIIPKSSKAEHVADNAKVGTERRVHLTAENLADIARLDGSIGKPW